MRRPATLLTRMSLLVGVLAAVLALGSPASVADTPSVPSDPAAHGYIGLCDEAGRNVAGGSINTAPFIWKAVASQAPPAGYTGAGQNAVLTIFQPRPQIPASGWSGVAVAADSYYTVKTHPTVQATYLDKSLKTVVSGYPPLVDGLYVLRMSFGRTNYGLYNATYPTTTIQVVGQRWRVIAGGTVDCHAATATSIEAMTGVADKGDTTPRTTSSAGQHALGSGAASQSTHSKSGSSAGSASSAAPGASFAPGSGTGPYSQQPVALDAAGNPIHHSGSSAWWWLLAVVAVLLLAGGGFLTRRRMTTR